MAAEDQEKLQAEIEQKDKEIETLQQTIESLNNDEKHEKVVLNDLQ